MHFDDVQVSSAGRIADFGWLAGSSDVKVRWPLIASVLSHCLLLLALLRPGEPTFVKPNAIAAGTNGTAVTQIYWPGQRDDHTQDSSADRTQARDAAKASREKRLEWQRSQKKQRPAKDGQPVHLAKADEIPTSLDQPGAHQSAPAGSPFGSLSYGAVFGMEIRPAYPLSGSDPIASPGELPPGFEGDVVVEVTIDEQGTIVDKSVIQSINPALDAKSLLALATWRFRPATRNGIPIASKHDVYFHFRSR